MPRPRTTKATHAVSDSSISSAEGSDDDEFRPEEKKKKKQSSAFAKNKSVEMLDGVNKKDLAAENSPALNNLSKKGKKFWLIKVPADFDFTLLDEQDIQIDAQIPIEKKKDEKSYEIRSKSLPNDKVDSMKVLLPLKGDKLKAIGEISNYVTVMKKIEVPPLLIPFNNIYNSAHLSSPEKLKMRNVYSDTDNSIQTIKKKSPKIKKEKKNKSPKKEKEAGVYGRELGNNVEQTSIYSQKKRKRKSDGAYPAVPVVTQL